MAIYYPRFALDITVPVAGSAQARRVQDKDESVVRWTMPVSWFRLERNDYSQADVLEVRADWSTAGLDPRVVTDATCAFSIGQASPTNPTGDWTPGPGDLRFAGVLMRPKRVWSDTKRQVTLLFHDYTSFFIREKPFVTKGLPDYSQTLSQAWARICDHVGPTDPETGEVVSVIGADLRNRIEFRGSATDVLLGKAVASRFRKDKLGAAGPTDAWAVWQQCVQTAAYVSWIDVDHLVISDATDVFTAKSPPRLVMGQNLIDLEEERDVTRSQGGIVVECIDPLTGTVLEAFAPPLGDSSARKKALKGKKPKTADQTLSAENRERYTVQAITDPGALQALADYVQTVRSHEELAGTVTTAAMSVPTGAGADFDLLTLGAGDAVRIEVDQDLLEELKTQRSTFGTGDQGRIDWLASRGYDEGPARVLLANLDTLAALGSVFLVRSVETEVDAEGDSPSYRMRIHYVNKITKSGEAA